MHQGAARQPPGADQAGEGVAMADRLPRPPCRCDAVTSAVLVWWSCLVEAAGQREQEQAQGDEEDALHSGNSSSGGIAWNSPSM